MRKLLSVIIAFSFIACKSIQKTPSYTTPKLKLINTIEIPFNKVFENTFIGGLSGIDYDKKNDLYYLISDDRSERDLARFYTAKIHLAADTLQSIVFEKAIVFKNKAGENYSNWKTNPDTSIDPEDIRFNPINKNLVWCSEGARVITEKATVLQNPEIQTTTLSGTFIDNYHLPSNLITQKNNKGPRNNGAFEGISFDNKFRTIFTTLEAPLIEDGAEATTTKGGLIRIYQYDVKSKTNIAQYGYQLEPVARAPIPENGFYINGISAIQYYNKNQLLVVERSFSVGKQSCTIKIYLCDLSKASDVKNRESFQNQSYTLAQKKLVLNLDDLGVFVDNVEGITFGPQLSNGNRSLILVTDNNFLKENKTQLFLFEID